MRTRDYRDYPYSIGGSTRRKIFPFLRWWHFIGWDTLKADFRAGLTGAIIVLPQGVAFAMIAGLPPQYGLYTAIVTPIVAALFGSSMHLISGPTTAISIVVFTSISRFAEPGVGEFIRLALTLTFLAGAVQLVLGLMRLGTLVNFVSHSVVVGFTAGAAILIATNQLKHILGYHVPGTSSFLASWTNILAGLESLNFYVLSVAMITLVSAIFIKWWRPRWPGLLIAMVVGSLSSLILGGEEHGISVVGKLPASLPPFSMPDFSMGTVRELAPEALAVALLGLIEALSIARSISTHSRQYIDASQEFVGQGLSNIVGSFFSCYAGSGSFTRSGINYFSGAMTPLSAVFSALLLALILLLVAPLTAYLPMPAMGGVILFVAYHLIDFHHIRNILKISRQETAIMVATFLATLFIGLEFAIIAGVLLSFIFYLHRTTHPSIVNLAPNPHPSGQALIQMERECPQFKIIRIDGSLFFGAIHHVATYLQEIDKHAAYKRHVLIVAYGINFLDLAGAEMLAHESQRRRKLRGGLYLCGLKHEARGVLERGGYIHTIGRENIFETETEALSAICSRLDTAQCRLCSSPLFQSCR